MSAPWRGFASDNYAGIHPEVLDAIAAVNAGHQVAYGDDDVTAALTDAMIEADPAKEWPGYTHVSALGDAIAAICTNPVDNGARVDLTAAP